MLTLKIYHCETEAAEDGFEVPTDNYYYRDIQRIEKVRDWYVAYVGLGTAWTDRHPTFEDVVWDGLFNCPPERQYVCVYGEQELWIRPLTFVEQWTDKRRNSNAHR